jgi:hypothetical protein
MGLDMRRVDHQPIRCVAVGRQFGEDAVEHARPVPPNEAVVDRLGWSVGRRHIPPPQTAADHEKDAAQHTPVIHPRNPVRKWKIGLDPAHLRL